MAKGNGNGNLAVVPQQTAEVSLADFLDEAGLGVSFEPEDMSVPLMTVLQPLSPQVMKGDAVYIQGAEAGDIYLQNSPVPIIKGGDGGILFQPCFYSRTWDEWVPRIRGGGFRGKHKSCPTNTQLTQVQAEGGGMRMSLLTPEGHEVIETRTFAGRAQLPNGMTMPFNVPFKSTGHRVAKNWLNIIQNLRLPNGAIAPIYSHWYKLTTVQQRKNNNTWFTFQVQLIGPVSTMADKNEGRALHDACARGEAVLQEALDISQQDPHQEAL